VPKAKTHRIRLLESRVLGNLQARFGGGRMEKGCNRLSSDRETGISHSLASRLPYHRAKGGRWTGTVGSQGGEMPRMWFGECRIRP